ncbi:hypothetical protein GCM10012275_59440 [Longimycelium tulufanense]|uniref:Uncharacterized protein n=1 Tax=Longimycelium tulufanense TaxID=907463 RepID=A0A8J3CE18_9PSEU|nr:hypothetical protein GCM10012275_59440 [Longimycelium tulufanense]
MLGCLLHGCVRFVEDPRHQRVDQVGQVGASVDQRGVDLPQCAGEIFRALRAQLSSEVRAVRIVLCDQGKRGDHGQGHVTAPRVMGFVPGRVDGLRDRNGMLAGIAMHVAMLDGTAHDQSS